MKTRITLLFSLILFLSVTSVLGQEKITGLKYEDLLPDFNKITPEAASLGKYGSIGCSEYTGVPDIKVPLFDIKSGDLSVPVSLYYDASGIKVEQEATFVGLGWNLSYGGCITRIICGNDDYLKYPWTRRRDYVRMMDSLLFRQRNEDMFSPFNSDINLLLYPLFREISIPIFWQHLGVDENGDYWASRLESKKDSDVYYLLNDIEKGNFVPDIYQASFCGHSVSFIIEQETSEINIIGDDASKYKIEIERSGTVFRPSGFVITDSQGTIYHFTAYCEYGNTINSFYLDSVTDVSGKDWIRYSYEQKGMRGQCSFYQSKGKAVKNKSITTKVEGMYLDRHSRWTGESNYMCNKVYPSQVETPLETIFFHYDSRTDMSGGQKIMRITVTSKNGNKITHQTDLTYDYFQEVNMGGLATDVPDETYHYKDDNPKERLKLTGVRVDGMDYGFGYEESIPLPYSASLSQDFWGYYNGINNVNRFVATPRYKYCLELQEVPYIEEANRYCSAEYCKVGVLNRITYPTGGYSTFEYEVNHFNDPRDYYYTDASLYRKEYFQNTTTIGNVHVISALTEQQNVYESQFTLDENKDVKLYYSLHADLSSDYVYARMQGPGINLDYTLTHDMNLKEGDTLVHLTPGTYTIRAYATPKRGIYSTRAIFRADTDEIRSTPLNPVGDESGKSIGGGLRIKSIRNFSGGEDDRFLGGTDYAYQGGELLVPTVFAQLQRIYECVQSVTPPSPPDLIATYSYADRVSDYYFAGSSASFTTISSFGSPTVGYSAVVKKELKADGTVGRTTKTIFHNLGYDIIEPYNLFFHPNHGMNGKPIENFVLSAEGDTLSKTVYDYESKAGKRILYPLCQKMYIFGNCLPKMDFRLSTYVKSNIWHYMTRKVETQYEGGKPMTPVVTDYTYNNENYQTSKSTRRQGTQVIEDRYQYSVDGVTVGSDLLIDKHILSRLTGTRQYLNGNLTGGAQLDFREHDTIQHDSIPVVKMFRNILPSGKMDTVLTVVDYDERGNIREYVTKNGTHTTILWSHNYQYPVMQIVGATYEDVKRAYHAISVIGKQKTISLSMMKTLHNMFSAIKEGELQVTAYVYDPWYGVSDIIQPNGKVMHYDKDSHGRLSKILEDSATGPVVQRFFYHYRNR